MLKRNADVSGLLKIILTIFSISIVAGCSAPKYLIPEGSPSAKLRSKIRISENPRDRIEILKIDDGFLPNPVRLFYINESKINPPDSIEIEAEKDINLVYFGSPRKHNSCFVRLRMKFEAGKEYSLVGGPIWEFRPFPFIDVQSCEMSVHNDTDNIPASISVLPREVNKR